MQTGTVKFFNEARGYGFIVDDESQKEIFVHVTGLGGVVIREKDRVEYEIVDGKKGLNATKVKKIWFFFTQERYGELCQELPVFIFLSRADEMPLQVTLDDFVGLFVFQNYFVTAVVGYFFLN